MKYVYENVTVLFSLLQYIKLLQNHKPAMKAKKNKKQKKNMLLSNI